RTYAVPRCGCAQRYFIFFLFFVFRTYAVGVLAGVTQRVPGAAGPENLLFPPTCGGIAATGGWKKKGVLWRALPSKPPNHVTPSFSLAERKNRVRSGRTDKMVSTLLPSTLSLPKPRPEAPLSLAPLSLVPPELVEGSKGRRVEGLVEGGRLNCV